MPAEKPLDEEGKKRLAEAQERAKPFIRDMIEGKITSETPNKEKEGVWFVVWASYYFLEQIFILKEFVE